MQNELDNFKLDLCESQVELRPTHEMLGFSCLQDFENYTDFIKSTF